jgi:hypothetical protein
MGDASVFISGHGFAEVRLKVANNQKGLFALRSFQPGEVISTLSAGSIVEDPTYLTLQVGDRKHITILPEFLQYVNHSCDPNTFFNTTTMQFVALKAIQPHDEFAFFYPSSELSMAQPFECYCGSDACIGLIKGAAFLSPEIRARYLFTEFIRNQLEQ